MLFRLTSLLLLTAAPLLATPTAGDPTDPANILSYPQCAVSPPPHPPSSLHNPTALTNPANLLQYHPSHPAPSRQHQHPPHSLQPPLPQLHRRLRSRDMQQHRLRRDPSPRGPAV